MTTPTPRTVRLRSGIQTVNGITGETAPTYSEYVLLEDYQRDLAAAQEARERAEESLRFVTKANETLMRIDHENAAKLQRAKERAAACERAVDELRNIEKTDYRKWDEGMRDPQSFVDWAQSRARHALAAIDAAQEPK